MQVTAADKNKILVLASDKLLIMQNSVQRKNAIRFVAMKGIVGGKSLILKIYTTNLGAMMGFSLFLQNMASSVLSTKKED